MSADPDEERKHPSAFISYAHSKAGWSRERTAAWKTTVFKFAVLLREMGIDAEVDQFYTHDPEVDWNRFGPTAAREKDFVLIAAGGAYKERWEGGNKPTEGAGAVRESDELMGQFNADQDSFQRRVKIVILPAAEDSDVPAQLSNLQRFNLEELSEAAAEDLYRVLTNQPATPKPELGPLRVLPVMTERAATHAEERAELEDQLARVQASLAGVDEADRVQAGLGHLSLPWIRTVRQLMDQEQGIAARLEELDRAERPASPAPPADPAALERLLREILEAASVSPVDDVVAELARRLSDPRTGPEDLLHLFTGLPGREIDIGAQKRVKYDLYRHGVLARNSDGQGFVIGTLP